MQSWQKSLAVMLVAAASSPLLAQEIPTEGPAQTTALINAEPKKDAQFAPAELTLEVDGHATPIEAVTRVQPAAAQVAILIDDGLRRSFALQLGDTTKFIQELPAGTQVMVGYMENGTIRSPDKNFTTDRESVVNDLRQPFSAVGISASPYICLSDFVKHWPSSQPAARFVLMITNGVDPYNGSVSILNQDSPYVRSAQEDAQRAGVAVYSIYYGDRLERGGAVSFSGQSYLQQVSAATGGQSFYQGTITPPSLAPYFAQFATAMQESYLVHFTANANHEKKDTLQYIKLKTKQKDIKLNVPNNVHPGSVDASRE